VNNLVVDRRARQQGVGQELLRVAIRHCKERDVIELHVWTDSHNALALRLYRKMGFSDRGLLLELPL
jgi:ribosomal protein S18 acetylase RimI-like enzyme